MHVEGAIEQVHGLQVELEDIRQSAVNGSLVPLPGESVSLLCTVSMRCYYNESVLTTQILMLLHLWHFTPFQFLSGARYFRMPKLSSLCSCVQ